MSSIIPPKTPPRNQSRRAPFQTPKTPHQLSKKNAPNFSNHQFKTPGTSHCSTFLGGSSFNPIFENTDGNHHLPITPEYTPHKSNRKKKNMVDNISLNKSQNTISLLQPIPSTVGTGRKYYAIPPTPDTISVASSKSLTSHHRNKRSVDLHLPLEIISKINKNLNFELEEDENSDDTLNEEEDFLTSEEEEEDKVSDEDYQEIKLYGSSSKNIGKHQKIRQIKLKSSLNSSLQANVDIDLDLNDDDFAPPPIPKSRSLTNNKIKLSKSPSIIDSKLGYMDSEMDIDELTQIHLPSTPNGQKISESMIKQWHGKSFNNQFSSDEEDDDPIQSIKKRVPSNPFITTRLTSSPSSNFNSNPFLTTNKTVFESSSTKFDHINPDTHLTLINKKGDKILRKLTKEEQLIKPKKLNFNKFLDEDEDLDLELTRITDNIGTNQLATKLNNKGQNANRIIKDIKKLDDEGFNSKDYLLGEKFINRSTNSCLNKFEKFQVYVDNNNKNDNNNNFDNNNNNNNNNNKGGSNNNNYNGF